FRVLAAATAVTVAAGIGALAAPPVATASGISVKRACPPAEPGHATCFALHVTGAGQISPHAGPAGYHPADLISAYGLDPTKGGGQKIAVINAYNNPNAEADLG